ncbi:NTP transferase domain-containing protein, partial [Acidimicrobiaceae bacterium USS-CC1]|nr:NTP transferase domain-containing protein [Acidiferrimicrobium australe]
MHPGRSTRLGARRGHHGPVDVAALLLTGGRSRRMGRDKAALVVGGRTLAQRTADLLRRAGLGGPLLELGPGVS